MSSKRILVTGAAGFLGSHLCWHLLEAGHVVIGLDSEITGNPVNLLACMQSPDFTYIKHDIRDYFECGAVDDIYHLACLASPKYYLVHPIVTWETSVLGMRNILQFASKIGAKVLFTSTSEVYGDPQVHPQPETYWGNVNPVGPRSCYDEGKRAAETLCYEYCKLGVDVRVVRIFNTFGPHMDPEDGRVVPQFIMQALHNEPLTVYGSGDQIRSFCYVSDMIRGICAVMAYETPYFGPLNLGSQEVCSILDLAKRILVLTNSLSEIVYVTLPDDDPRLRQPDTGLVYQLLGWRAGVSLDDGLGQTISYFKHGVHL